MKKMAQQAKISRMSKNGMFSVANNDFSCDLYEALFAQRLSRNVIFSSFSLHTGLGMLSKAAKGDTRTEILETLMLDPESEDDDIGKTYQVMINGLQVATSPNTFTLITANKIYCTTGFAVDKTFVDSLKEHFKADFQQLNFESATTPQRMNDWVTTASNNVFEGRDPIPQGFFGQTTSIVLVNLISFKGLWEHPFDENATSVAKFNVTQRLSVNVDMMRKEFCFPFRDIPKLKARAVSLPYNGGRLSMVIVLPKAVDGLPLIQSKLGNLMSNGRSIVDKDSGSPNKIIELSLPKFKIEATMPAISQILRNTMDMKIMFNKSQADFGGIPEDPEDEEGAQICVTNVLQKASIEVDEKGAATPNPAIPTKKARGRIARIPFVVEHPFYFQIVDHVNDDMVLLSGHCNNPATM